MDAGGTTWASPSKVARGCIAFAVWWIFAVSSRVPFIPIGRTAGSLLGATLMVVFHVISADAAFAAIDLSILALLFGTMVVSVYLGRAGLFEFLGRALSWRTRGGWDLLCRVCLLAALSSALFTNDTTCIVFTGFVLKLCRDKKLRPKPFLLALACSSNIGSAATPIGNPQNLVIAINSRISFGRFLAGVLPAMALGLVVNTLLLVVVYWRSLSMELTSSEDTELPVVGDSETSRKEVLYGRDYGRFTLLWMLDRFATHSHSDKSDHNRDLEISSSVDPQSGRARNCVLKNGDISDYGEGSGQRFVPLGNLPVLCVRNKRNAGDEMQNKPGRLEVENRAGGKRGISKAFALFSGIVRRSKCAAMFGHRAHLTIRNLWRKHKQRIWKTRVYLVTLGMLAALLAGLSLPWTAMTAAVFMMVLDRSDAGPNLDKVNYALLVFFSGMFIATSGFDKTGAPGVFWKAVEPHSQIDSASGVTVLSLVVTVLSNVVSNVPTVILLGPRVAASAAGTSGASSEKAWLLLAWVSTVAGNLTLVGSAANIIVCEQAREIQAEKDLREESKLRGDPQGQPERATYDLKFWSHLKFGFPSTLIVIAVGVIPIMLRKL